MALPRISVVVPTFNRREFLAEALASVVAQTVPVAEIVVVDDGSTDGTAESLAAFPGLTCLRQENRGIGAARNAGAARTSGEYLAFLDDDDLWVENKLERQLAEFAARPELDAVYGHAEHFITPGLDEDSRRRLAAKAASVGPAFLPTALLIRRAAFDRVGPFDESLRLGVEIEWFARFAERGIRTAMLDDVVYRRRLHSTNISHVRPGTERERLLTLKRVIDRRRASAP